MREALERRAADWLAKKTGRSGPMFTAHTFARIAAWMAEFLLACIEDGTLRVCGECGGSGGKRGTSVALSVEDRPDGTRYTNFGSLPCPACTSGIAVKESPDAE